MLFISDLNISREELQAFIRVYKNDFHQAKYERLYEVVWLPVHENSTQWTQDNEDKFNHLQSLMPWYSLHHPSSLHPAVIKYIKNVWKLNKKLLVVLNSGRILSIDTFPMIWIWGNDSYPFTKEREEELWQEVNLGIEFMVDGIDPAINTWIKEGRFICLYGGENIEWIKDFTSKMRRVAREAGIPIEMVYVGKSDPNERVMKNIRTITEQKLSHCLKDLVSIWFFWVRLSNIYSSRHQLVQQDANDNILKEAFRMLSFDGRGEEWAILGWGTGEMAKGGGENIIKALERVNEWKVNIQNDGFIRSLIHAIDLYKSDKHDERLLIHAEEMKFHEHIDCAECGRPMEKFLIFKCCI